MLIVFLTVKHFIFLAIEEIVSNRWFRSLGRLCPCIEKGTLPMPGVETMCQVGNYVSQKLERQRNKVEIKL